MNKQICRVCMEEKPCSEFHYRRENQKYRTNCKTCRNKQEAARRYNVSVGYIDLLLNEQNSSCAICNTHLSDISHKSFTTNPLVIDHDHKTGKVRGLLCPTCNNGLGLFKDNPNLLANAIQYILRNNYDYCTNSDLGA